MAEQATERMVVSADPARCFEISADIATLSVWAADIKEVTVVERDAEGRPSLVTFRAAAFGRSTSYTLAYDYAEAPRCPGLGADRGRHHVQARRSLRLRRHLGRGDRGDVPPRGGDEGPLPGFIKMRAQSRIMSIALRDLKARVESTA